MRRRQIMPGDAILTYDDYVVGAEKTPGAEVIMPAGPRDYADYLAYYHLQHTGDPLPDVPQAPLPDAVLQVNAGRWVFQCDTCDGGTLVKPDHPVICVFCGHQWRQPRFPGERAEIEAELLKQPGRRLFAPIRNWKYGWTLAQLQDRTRRANEKVAAGELLVRALSIGATRVWTAGETLSASNMNLYVSDVADDLAGRNGVVELENGLRIIPGNGSRYLGLPAGAETQRPASPAEGMVRFNSTDGAIDVHNGTAWEQVLTSKALTYANLNARGLVGPGAAQVAQGNHTHEGTPEAPTGLTATANQSTKRVSLSWTAPTNNGGSAITGYVVYRTGQSSGTYTLTGTGTTYTTPALSPGSYTFTVAAVNSVGTGTVSGGATATLNAATLRVTISGSSNALPGASVSLTASVSGGIAPYTYSWSGSGVSGSGSSATVTRSNAGSRTATVTVTDSAGTQATDTHTVTFSYSTLRVSISGVSSIVRGNSVTLTAAGSGGSGGYSYSWSSGETTSSITKSPTATTTYTVTVTDSAGSTSTDTHTVTVTLPALSVSISGDTSAVSGDSDVYTATATGGDGSYSYSWLGRGQGTGATRTVYWTNNDAANSPITITVTVTDGQNNTATASITVTVSYPTLSVSISGDTSAVSGDSDVYTATATGGDGSYSYSWHGRGQGTGATRTVYWTNNDAANSPITITVTVTDGQNNTATASITVTVSSQ